MNVTSAGAALEECRRATVDEGQLGQARPIFSVGDLVGLAGEIGLDTGGAREALLSPVRGPGGVGRS